MKTIIICILFIFVQLKGSAAFISINDNNGELPKESSWVKSETGMWFGDYNTWYKIDNSSMEAKLSNAIKLSYNKKKWISSTDVAWQDKEGKWYYISNNRLLCTSDNKHWIEVPSRTWLGIDGVWCRFDANWELWEAKL